MIRTLKGLASRSMLAPAAVVSEVQLSPMLESLADRTPPMCAAGSRVHTWNVMSATFGGFSWAGCADRIVTVPCVLGSAKVRPV